MQPQEVKDILELVKNGDLEGAASAIKRIMDSKRDGLLAEAKVHMANSILNQTAVIKESVMDRMCSLAEGDIEGGTNQIGGFSFSFDEEDYDEEDDCLVITPTSETDMEGLTQFLSGKGLGVQVVKNKYLQVWGD